MKTIKLSHNECCFISHLAVTAVEVGGSAVKYLLWQFGNLDSK